MKQLTLAEGVVAGTPKAPPRDPDIAEDLHEYCQLFRAKYGRYPKGREQVQAMERHGWGEPGARARAKRALRQAVGRDE
jgi:hypothetical protein